MMKIVLMILMILGAAFMEIFNAEGDGVRHAVVTGVERGKMLRYEGPLGLAPFPV